MSEGRRASNAQRRRNTSSSGEDRSPFVLRSGPRRAFDYIRSRTTSSPARFAVVVFVALILLFTALLSLPAATNSGDRLPFADALFTAVSTICVTGLSTVDVATTFSPLGKAIIFVGVNIGGMGVLTLASILGLVISKRLGLRAKLIAASDTNPLRSHGGPVNEGQTVRLGEVGVLLRTVALSTLVIEGVIALLLYPSLIIARHRPARRAVGGAVLRRDGVHQHRLHPERRRSRAVRRRLPPAHGADGRRLPRLDRLPGDLHAVEALLARAPLDAARQAHPHHHRRPVLRRRGGLPGSWSSTTPRRSAR